MVHLHSSDQVQHVRDHIRENNEQYLSCEEKLLWTTNLIWIFSRWACRDTPDSFQGNKIKALKKHWMWMLYHRPVGRPDQCLLHQRFGLDLFIPQIDLNCFASGHLYNTCVVVCLSQGGPYKGPMYCTNSSLKSELLKGWSFSSLQMSLQAFWLQAQHFLHQLVELDSVIASAMCHSYASGYFGPC